jgi:predicted acylesterase/phospholipase RssA
MATSSAPIKALVLSGSGTLFPNHLGFLQAILESDLTPQIECVSGVSGGSFCAMLFLVCSVQDDCVKAFEEACADFLRYGIDELITKLDLSLLLTNYGLLSIEPFECHFIDVIRIHGKCDAKQGRPGPFMTFKELYEYTGKTFVVVASDPATNKPKYFSHLETPNIRVLSAVRFSMTVTGLFSMERNNIDDEWHLPKYSPDGWQYVDGCFTDSYPLQYVADLLQLPSKTSPEILGNFIGDSVIFDNSTTKSFLASQAAWVLSSRIQPDPVNSIILPMLPKETVFARLSLDERTNLMERARIYTTTWLNNKLR